MVKAKYVPDRGDIVWLGFETGIGREQAGKRPALIISPKIYNNKSGLALVCPITSRRKGYPFEVWVETEKARGAVLADQLKSVDWGNRKARFICKIRYDLLRGIQDKLALLIT